MKKNSGSHFAVKRIMTELKDMRKNPCEEFTANPISGNIFEWHFTLNGPPDTPFEGGMYHGKLIMPTQYPFKPPDLMMLTPNGRFETNKKICLNVTSFHKELWKPGWGIRTILLALIGFFPLSSDGIGAIKYPDHIRKSLAKESKAWKCSCCKKSNTEIIKNLKRIVSKKKGKKKEEETEEEENIENNEEKKKEKKKKSKKSKKKKKKKKSKLRERKRSSRKRKESRNQRKRIQFVEEEETISQKLLNVFITLVLLSLVYGVVRFGVVGNRF